MSVERRAIQAEIIPKISYSTKKQKKKKTKNYKSTKSLKIADGAKWTNLVFKEKTFNGYNNKIKLQTKQKKCEIRIIANCTCKESCVWVKQKKKYPKKGYQATVVRPNKRAAGVSS